jgi:hypothetical protein
MSVVLNSAAQTQLRKPEENEIIVTLKISSPRWKKLRV